MNKGTICHFSPKGGIDERIAGKLGLAGIGGKEDINALRNVYDMEHETPLIALAEGQDERRLSDDVITAAAKELLKYREQQVERHLKEMKKSVSHLGKTFSKFYQIQGWNAATRRNRINMVALEFSREVSKRVRKAEDSGISLSREQVVNGYKSNGVYHDGQASVFESVFNNIFNRYKSALSAVRKVENIYSKLSSLPPEKRAIVEETLIRQEAEIADARKVVAEYPKILSNWASLCTFARMSLRDTESLKLGATLEYAAPTTPDNFSMDIPEEEWYDVEAVVREAWQNEHASRSSFASAGTEVRRFISTVPEVDENGVGVKDDLGYPVMMDPLYVHQFLESLLRGIDSEEALLQELWALSEEDPTVEAIFRALQKTAGVSLELKGMKEGKLVSTGFNPISDTHAAQNPMIITQLLVDMNKNFVEFSALKRATNKAKGIVATILNRVHNPLQDEFLLRLRWNSPLDSNSENSKSASVFTPSEIEINVQERDRKVTKRVRKNIVNWDVLASVLSDIDMFLPSKEQSEEETNIFKTKKRYGTSAFNPNTNYAQRVEFLVRNSRILGIPLTHKIARSMMHNSKQLGAYLEALQDVRKLMIQILPNNLGPTLESAVAELRKSTTESASESRNLIKKLEELAVEDPSNIMDYNSIVFAKFGKSEEKDSEKPKGAVEEKINKMLNVIAATDRKFKSERRVSWYDRHKKAASRYSDLAPSYMGDLVNKIRRFVEKEDAKGLKEFIEQRWGGTSFFVKEVTNGKYTFYNKWIQELYNSLKEDSYGNVTMDSEALANVFKFVEFLGSDIDKTITNFEDFSIKQHAESMLINFLQPRKDYSKSMLAQYPCFILGDSGKQRFFTARRYTKDAILNGLVDVVRQERERIKYVKATNEILLKFFADKNGYTFQKNENGNLELLDESGKVIPQSKYSKLGFRPIENFSKTANEFTMLRFLNTDFEDGRYWKMLTGEEEIPVSKEEAMSKALEPLNIEDTKNGKRVRDAIEAYMNKATADFKKRLVDQKVLQTSEKDGKTVYEDYQHLFGKNLGMYENSIEKMVEDFFWNTKYATIEQLQVFTIDPAYYDYRYPVKDLQKRYKEIYAPGKRLSVTARFKGKRFSKRDYETAVYFDDISINSEEANPLFMEVILRNYARTDLSQEALSEAISEGVLVPKEKGSNEEAKRIARLRWLLGDNYNIYKAYTKNTLTDGQGYRTLESYRAVKGMAGEWTLSMEAAYNEIQGIRARNKEGEGLSTQDIARLRELAVVFQPIKPYLYTFEKIGINNNDNAFVPVQHKYAEIVLIPELMAEGKLKDMAYWMEEHDVDLLASTKCVKVGAFGSVDIVGTGSTEDVRAVLDKAYVHNLSWSDYRIQQPTPEHLTQAQLFGTQPRKLVFDAIDKGKYYKEYLEDIFKEATNDPKGLTVFIPGMGDVHLTGRNLISFYNSLIASNILEDLSKLEKECSSIESLSDNLIQNVISNARQSEDNAFAMSIEELVIDGKKYNDFVNPLGEPVLEHDSTGRLMSLFKKMVNKQKILGGSAVQASALGISGIEEIGDLFEVVDPEGRDNVLYDEVEMPWNKTYTSATGKTVPLKFEDWCNLDGTLKLADGKEGRPLKIVKGKEAKDYLSWPVSGRDKYGRPKEVGEDGYDPNGYYVPLIETKYPGILDIILYRIPTEKEYSMILGRVFRFTPPTLGGILKVPSSRTTTAGFDFDIDKLQFFLREFSQLHLSPEKIDEIWKRIYSESGALYEEFSKRLAELHRNYDSYESEGMGEALAALFPKSDIFNELSKGSSKRLYNYNFWELAKTEDDSGKFAEIPATAEEAFTKFLEEHRSEYPVFATYDRKASPLNPQYDKKGNLVKAGNTRAARNNMLIDIFKQRLRDPETLKSRYTPGAFENNRDAALKMRILEFMDPADISTNGKIDWGKVNELADKIRDDEDPLKDPEPEYDVSDPSTILIYNQQNQIASKLIGIFANHNTNHIYTSTLHEFKLVKPIKFGNHTSVGLDDFIHGPVGVNVGVNVAEDLAASVDAVKDPVLNFLNLNLLTANAAAMLKRIGYTPLEIGLLLRQPAIMDVCNYVANNNTNVDHALNEILKTYGDKKTTIKTIQFEPNNVSTDRLAANILERRKTDKAGTKDSQEFKNGQLQVLKLFNDILSAADELNSFVQCTRFTAANSVGSTWGDFFAQEMKVQAFVDKYTKGDKKNRKLEIVLFDPKERSSNAVVSVDNKANKSTKGIIDTSPELIDMKPEEYLARISKSPLAFEQAMMDAYRKAARKIFGKYYPYFSQLYTVMRDGMKRISKYGNLDADTINSLHREFLVYLLTCQGGAFNGEASCELSGALGVATTNRDFYTNYFPMLLQVFRDAGHLADYPIFSSLDITQDNNDPEKLQIALQGMGGLQSHVSNSFTEMWADALQSDQENVFTMMDEEDGSTTSIKIKTSDFAKGLFMYCFYKHGFNFHPTVFLNLAPTVLRLALDAGEDTIVENGVERKQRFSYIDFMRALTNPERAQRKIGLSPDRLQSFMKQYILNHLDNRSFVFKPTGMARILVNNSEVVNEKGVLKDSFTLRLSEDDSSTNSLYTIKDPTLTNGEKAFIPCLAIEINGNTEYYMANSDNPQGFNISDGSSMTYKRVVAQGGKGIGIQYFTMDNSDGYQKMAKGLAEEQGKQQDEKEKQQSPERDGIMDSTPDSDPVVTPIETPLTVAKDVLTAKEWEFVFNKYKNSSRDILRQYEGITSDQFAEMLTSNPRDEGNRRLLQSLIDQLKDAKKRGEFKTLDEEGNEVTPC